jgi:uncharacterized protein YbjT (DUF2867 family)
MKFLVLRATGGTGRLVVRDELAKSDSVVALVRSKARALGSRYVVLYLGRISSFLAKRGAPPP